MSEDKNVDLIEKARTEYGIVNADQMSQKQLKDEMKAIDNMPKTAEKPEGKATKPSEEDNEEDTLKGLSRVELEEKATEYGVEDPSNKTLYPNMEVLKQAIRDHSETPEDEE